jgi:hypothetical protein
MERKLKSYVFFSIGFIYKKIHILCAVMNNIFVFFVILVGALILWLRFRSKIAPENADQWWFTVLNPETTDPNTPWYNLLRIIVPEEPLPVYSQWISSNTMSILDANGAAVAKSKATPDVKTWKAQRRDDRFVMWGSSLATFNPILRCTIIIIEHWVGRNNNCEQSLCHPYSRRFVSHTGNIKYTINGHSGLHCVPM